MSEWHIAHIREQGIDLIIVPLDDQFEYKPDDLKQELIDGLQLCAGSAGLAGKVVPVWLVGGRMKFIAPPNWHPFFKSITWNRILQSRNKKLTCG